MTPTETTNKTTNDTATTTGTACTDSAAVLAKPDLLMAVLIALVLGLAK